MKNMIYVNINILISIFIFSQLVGCGVEKVSTDSSQASASSHGADNLQADLAEKRVVADKKSVHKEHRYVKPGAAVSLKNAQPLFASAPGTYEYQLRLVSPHNAGDVKVSVSSSDGIEIVSEKSQFEFDLSNGAEYVLPVTVNASREGRFYIHLQVSITADGQTSLRSIAAILQVGEPAVTKQKASLKSSNGTSDGVIVLPAQETISPR